MDKKACRRLTLRYALLQALYFASFATIYAFASVFLLARGFSNTQIGILLAVANIVSVVLMPLLASSTDKSRRLTARTAALALIAVTGVFALALWVLPFNFIGTAALYAAVVAFMLSQQPFINSLGSALDSPSAKVNFGAARSAGSLAYAGLAAGLGYLVSRLGVNMVPILYLLLCAGLGVACLLFRAAPAAQGKHPDAPEPQASEKGARSGLLRFAVQHKRFMLYIVGAALLFTSYNIVNLYLVQIVTYFGGDTAEFGFVTSLTALLEVPTMLAFAWLVRRLRCDRLLKTAGVFFTLKILLYVLATSTTLLYVGQLLQPLSYALFIPASVYYVNHLLPAKNRNKGHAFTTVSNTLGGMAGTLLGGRLLDIAGVLPLLVVSLLISLAGTVIFFFSLVNPAKSMQVTIEDSNVFLGKSPTEP